MLILSLRDRRDIPLRDHAFLRFRANGYAHCVELFCSHLSHDG